MPKAIYCIINPKEALFSNLAVGLVQFARAATEGDPLHFVLHSSFSLIDLPALLSVKKRKKEHSSVRPSFLCIVTGRESQGHSNTQTFRHALTLWNKQSCLCFILFFFSLRAFSLFLLHYEKLDLAATCHTE